MALVFGAATSHRVDVGSAASLDDLPSKSGLTFILWVRATTLTDTRKLISKGRGSTGIGWQLGVSGTSGNLQMLTERATTDSSYITNDTPLALNEWRCVEVTSDTNATPVTRIRVGSLTKPLTESGYATAADGSGAYQADAARLCLVGNIDNTSINLAFQGDMLWAGIWPRVLSLAEGNTVRAMFLPGYAGGFQSSKVPGSVLWMPLGFESAASRQIDYSNWGNHGTVTGATQTADPYDLVGQPGYAVRRQRIFIPSGTTTTVTPATLALTTATFAPKLTETATPTTLGLSLTTFAPTLVEQIIPSTAALSITTFAPSLATATVLIPATATLSLTTFAPTLAETITPATISLSTTAFAPQLIQTITPGTAGLTIATFAPQLSEAVVPGTASLAVTGFAPALSESIVPGVASLALSGFAPALVESLTPGILSLTLTAFAPTVSVASGTTVTPNSASLVLTLYAPTLIESLQPSTAIFVTTGFAPTVTVVIPPPSSRTLTSQSESRDFRPAGISRTHTAAESDRTLVS